MTLKYSSQNDTSYNISSCSHLKLAVTGNPISHSRTPQLQAMIGAHFGISVHCDRVISDDNFIVTFKKLIDDDYNGFNCTMPCKTQAATLCNIKSSRSKLLNAVNTVKINNGSTYGDTTDGRGMLNALRRYMKEYDMSGTNAAIIGCGGTARSIILELADCGVTTINIINRNTAHADSIKSVINEYYPNMAVNVFPLRQIKQAVQFSSFIINATPLGMTGFDDFSDLGFIKEAKCDTVFADAVYKPRNTSFLSAASAAGYPVAGGIDMLIYQGIESFLIWTDIKIGDSDIYTLHDEIINKLNGMI